MAYSVISENLDDLSAVQLRQKRGQLLKQMRDTLKQAGEA